MTEKIITFPKFKKNKDTLHDINFFVFKTLVKSLNPMLELKKISDFSCKVSIILIMLQHDCINLNKTIQDDNKMSS